MTQGRVKVREVSRGFHPRLMTFGPIGASPPTRL
jgi:hypothetical protein